MLLSNAYNPDDRVRNEAIALKEAGYKVSILAWDRFLTKPEFEDQDDISINRVFLKSEYGQALKKYFSYILVWILFSFRVLKSQPDIIHCHDFDTYLVGVLYKRLNMKKKLVFDAHENFYMMMKPLVSKTTSRFIAYLEKKYIKVADLVIASCEANANHYRERGASNIVVVGNWKNPRLYEFPLEEINKKRMEIGAYGQLIFTYIGSLTMDRNVIPLLEAVQKRPWAYVIIGGTRGQESEIRQICAALPNAYYPGYIHPGEVPLFTSLSDVIYYGLDSSDLYAPYNAPNKLFEALAAGKPIIAGNLGGDLSRIINNEGCGILLEKLNSESIGAAIDKISEPNIRINMGQLSKIAGENTYNWKIACQILITSYEELFESFSLK